ncbi:mitochondrial carrier [Gigaspora margarita]|uniref:Mitochondrial carrier n=1 Tax=Gigaspora margarita TaxID=4874 RepID=A0A8H3X7Z6_GIGMA|nr:mitochondrial carrier [Gigaspora margarita]
MEKKTSYNINFAQALVAGGIAGTSVDVILYPLDTIKTRLQSKSGFYSSGGFRGIYSGLPSVIIGSAPGASAFFVTYEYFKKTLGDLIPDPKYSSLVHMTAASSGEVVACLIRTPTEVIKSRMQVKQYSSVPKAVKMIFQQEGFFAANYTHRKYIEPWEAAICGSFAGGITAGVTTPLDVIKTRLMLSTKGQNIHNYSGITNTFYRILTQEGIKALFSGIGPRVLWISIGGYIFLGAYEKVKKTLYKHEIFA